MFSVLVILGKESKFRKKMLCSLLLQNIFANTNFWNIRQIFFNPQYLWKFVVCLMLKRRDLAFIKGQGLKLLKVFFSVGALEPSSYPHWDLAYHSYWFSDEPLPVWPAHVWWRQWCLLLYLTVCSIVRIFFIRGQKLDPDHFFTKTCGWLVSCKTRTDWMLVMLGFLLFLWGSILFCCNDLLNVT